MKTAIIIWTIMVFAIGNHMGMNSDSLNKAKKFFEKIKLNCDQKGHEGHEYQVIGHEYRTLGSVAIDAGKEFGVKEVVLFAIIKQESRWNPIIVSPAGAIGLMQIMPATGKSFCGLSIKDLSNPTKNVRCGTAYFAYLYNKFENLKSKSNDKFLESTIKLALCAYNSGPSRVKALGRCPRIKETEIYVRNILRNLGTPKPNIEFPKPSTTEFIKVNFKKGETNNGRD